MDLDSILYVRYCVGQCETPLRIFKLRTMMPDADNHDHCRVCKLDNGGKPDPRVIPGRDFWRTYWIDELPQIYNILKGDLSIVGIRPRDRAQWAKEYPAFYAQAMKFKPGLFGAPYAYFPEGEDSFGFEEVRALELEYLERKDAHPLMTDAFYLMKILYNIVVKGVRSK